MSETDPSANGTQPAASDQPCDDCATPGEKFLAVLAAALGLFIIVLAVDMFTGGRITGQIAEQVQQVTQ